MDAALRLEWWDADPFFSKAVLAGLAFAASAALGGLLVKSPCALSVTRAISVRRER